MICGLRLQCVKSSYGRRFHSTLEMQNFMKCLMRMFAEQEKGVVFYETVINIRWQRHTFIECVPLPWDEFEAVPAYFKVYDFLYRLLAYNMLMVYMF